MHILKSLLFISSALGLVSCENLMVDPSEIKADQTGRQLVGPARDYVPSSKSMEQLASEVNYSMQKRRQLGWDIMEKVISPVSTGVEGQTIPLWMTWYDEKEVQSILSRGIGDLGAESGDKGLTSVQSRQVLEAHDSDREGINSESFATLLESLKDADQAIINGAGADQMEGLRRTGAVGFSPAFARHLLENYKDIARCDMTQAGISPADLDLTGADSFSECMVEFGTDSVMIKASWQLVEASNGDRCRIEAYDYSSDSWMSATKAMTEFTSEGVVDVYPFLRLENMLPPEGPVDVNPECGDSTLVSPRQVRGRYVEVPESDKIFTVQTRGNDRIPAKKWALRALHIVTKETREWVWASFAWSPDDQKNLDLGSDRPQSIPAPWSNYKLTIASGFEEKDPTPWFGANGEVIETLKSIYQNRIEWANHEAGRMIPQWATDPHIEIGDPDSNCIGCHQDPFRIRDGVEGSQKHRMNFPSDFSFQIAEGAGVGRFRSEIISAMEVTPSGPQEPGAATNEQIELAKSRLSEIFDTSCVGCHASGALNAPIFSTEEFVEGQTESARARRDLAVEYVFADIMPKFSPFTDEQKSEFGELVFCIKEESSCPN